MRTLKLRSRLARSPLGTLLVTATMSITMLAFGGCSPHLTLSTPQTRLRHSNKCHWMLSCDNRNRGALAGSPVPSCGSHSCHLGCVQGTSVHAPGHLPWVLPSQQQQHPDHSVSSTCVHSPEVLRLGLPGARRP